MLCVYLGPKSCHVGILLDPKKKRRTSVDPLGFRQDGLSERIGGLGMHLVRPNGGKLRLSSDKVP